MTQLAGRVLDWIRRRLTQGTDTDSYITFVCDGDLKNKLKHCKFHDLETEIGWWAKVNQ